MMDRREPDEIALETRDGMIANREAIEDLGRRFEPIEQVMDDIAAVGRFGAMIKSVVIWFTLVGASLTAAWHYISDIKTD